MEANPSQPLPTPVLTPLSTHVAQTTTIFCANSSIKHLFSIIQARGKLTTKALHEAHRRAGRTAEEEVAAAAAKICVREKKFYKQTGKRSGRRSFNVEADIYRAIVIGLEAGRIVDLKKWVLPVILEYGIFHYRYMHGDNVAFLVNKDENKFTADIFTQKCSLKIRDQYSPTDNMTKQRTGESEKKHAERNASLAYYKIAPFCREKNVPLSARE